jgi:hypothetical protein
VNLHTRRTAVLDRDTLGEVVRKAWVEWAREQPDPKPSWLVPWGGLGEADREADRRIGAAVVQAVVNALNKKRVPLIEKKNRGGGLSPDEEEEFRSLQAATFEVIELVHPRPRVSPADLAKLDELEKRLG